MKEISTRQSLPRLTKSTRLFSFKLGVFCAAIAIGALIAWTQQPLAAAASKTMSSHDGTIGSAYFGVNVPPTATFLHTVTMDNPESSDDPNYPVIIDLAQGGFRAGEEIKLTYSVQEPFTFNRNASPVIYHEPVVIAVFSRSGVLYPPSELKRVPDAVSTGADILTGPAGHLDASEPDDISEDFQILPATGTNVRIPEGATHLFLGVVDSFYKDNGGQISVAIERVGFYDVCLQDDATGDYLLFNSNTGDYKFVRCGSDGFVIEKPGLKHTINRIRNQVTLNDVVVSAVFDIGDRRGSVTIRTLGNGAVFNIRDSNTKDNTCMCR